MSVDLWVERVAARARVVVVRLLGGYDWWAYGCDRLAAVARERGIALALLPGECREDDARLAALSTVRRERARSCSAYFREGGPENMARAAGAAGGAAGARGRRRRGAAGRGVARRRVRPLADVRPAGGRWCRSSSTARCCSPGTQRRSRRWSAALDGEGIAGVPVFVPSLRDGEVLAASRRRWRRLRPAALVTATAFAAGEAAGSSTGWGCRSSRWCRRRRGARPGRRGRGGWRRPISRCTWCCRSSTGGSSPGRCRSRRRGRGTSDSGWRCR